MDLYSAERERRKQNRINQYLTTRYQYSARGRREAAKFERKKLVRKRAAALARLSEELRRCQDTYLNCLHQAGDAHRLARLLEKVEQLAVSKSSQKSNSQGNRFVKQTSFNRLCPVQIDFVRLYPTLSSSNRLCSPRYS